MVVLTVKLAFTPRVLRKLKENIRPLAILILILESVLPTADVVGTERQSWSHVGGVEMLTPVIGLHEAAVRLH